MSQQYLISCNKLIQNGKYQEAITGFEFILKIDPTSVSAFNGIAYSHAKLKNWQQSLTAILNAMGHGNNKENDLALFIQILEESQLQSYVSLVEKGLFEANKYNKLENKASSLLKIQFKAKYQPLLENLDSEFSIEHNVFTDKSLFLMMEKNFIADYQIENLILSARTEILRLAFSGKSIALYIPFLAAFASQVLLNDGLYHTEKENIIKLNQLDNNLENILLRICHSNIREIMNIWHENKELIHNEKTKSLISDLTFYEQVANIKNSNIEHVKDNTSKIVQSFYMQNPYPKWKTLKIEPNTLSIEGLFKQLDRGLSKTINILFAGCGTGHQVIECAINHPHIKIVAIDLSPNSLAYAIAMAEKYKLTNIQFFVLDILNVSSLSQSFDYIISTGVLHHMESPTKGLQSLEGVLKPDGIMHLAFYSKFAREELKQIKADVLEYLQVSESDITPSDIKEWRAQLKDKEKLRTWFNVDDFFYLNGLYDLLFHPQQIEYSLLEIQTLLESANLSFKWLPVTEQYQALFELDLKALPTKNNKGTLSYWHEFELNNPDYFMHMYDFFVTK